MAEAGGVRSEGDEARELIEGQVTEALRESGKTWDPAQHGPGGAELRPIQSTCAECLPWARPGAGHCDPGTEVSVVDGQITTAKGSTVGDSQHGKQLEPR